MGKFNEIQDEKTQSWGGNSFTTTVKENTVEFDSAKDKFTFKDAVEVPSLKVNGESVSSQVQADWNQNNSEAVDYIKNKPTIPSAQVQSDWNQNNSSEKDFIKNRICYDASTTQTYYTGNFGASGGTFTFESPYPFINGETYTFTIGSVVSQFIPQGNSDNVSGSCSINIPQGGASFSFSNSSQNCSVNISANPSEYANKDFTITKENVNIVKIDNKFLTETKKVNIEQGKSYVDKFNNNSGWGDGGASNTDTINIIVTDDMLDGQAYTFEGVIKCNSSASPQPYLKVKKNGSSVDTLPTTLPAITKNYVIYKITYIYSAGVDIVFVWTNID